MKRAFVLAVLLLTSGIALLLGGQTQANDPAPKEDRVGFPEGYKDWTVLYVLDSPFAVNDYRVFTVYGNEQAASAKLDEPFPYGSILASEGCVPLFDDQTPHRPILDENGRYQCAEPANILVMRKEEGFGEAYEHNRAGEWEFVAYRQDRSYATRPEQSAPCAACHQGARAVKDYVFRMGLFFNHASGAVPDGLMHHFVFVPDAIQAQAGGTVTWYNDDVIPHKIVFDSDRTGSDVMAPGASFARRFNEPGEYAFHCGIHPRMTGKVMVEGAN